MSDSLNSTPLIAILIGGILFTSFNSILLVKAQPTPTLLTIAVPSPPQGIPFSSECTIEATLKDENDNPLPNMDIDFLLACTGHTHLLDTAKTDSNGVASLTYSFVHTEKVSATFSGTTTYAPSSSEYVDIIVINYTPYLFYGGILGLGVAIIGVVGYIVFRRRKTVSTIPKTLKEA